MAKFEFSFQGDFDETIAYLHTGVLTGSASASFEDGIEHSVGEMRCAVRVYERFSFSGGNRVSLNLTLVGQGRNLYLCAITSGGSQAAFFKVNTLGEETFLDCIRELATRM